MYQRGAILTGHHWRLEGAVAPNCHPLDPPLITRQHLFFAVSTAIFSSVVWLNGKQ